MGFSQPRVAEDGTATQAARDAPAIGPRNAIERRDLQTRLDGVERASGLLALIVTKRVTASLMVMAMPFGLLLPHLLFERVLPFAVTRHDRSMHRNAIQEWPEALLYRY